MGLRKINSAHAQGGIFEIKSIKTSDFSEAIKK